jgi:DNA-binding winged helix-turn-helix (wHTH) protein
MWPVTSGSVRFGDVVVSFDRHEVKAGDAVQHLEPQAFDLLRYLITNAERVVPKQELLDEVWGHRFVTEAALTTRIKQIRQALGDTGRDQAVIRTVRRHGYQFVAPATTATEPVAIASGLLGRDDDIARIMALLGSARIVTLVGAGGVGKTSLAERIAEIRGRSRVENEFRGSVDQHAGVHWRGG